MNINVLSNEVLIGIFSLLTHNELGLVARVCKRWKELTRSTVLWKTVDARFDDHHGSQDVVLRKLMKSLSPCTTRIKLNFRSRSGWSVPLNFEELASELQGTCPNLEVLVIRMGCFTCTFSSFICLCAKFLPNIRVLSFEECEFDDSSAEVDCDDVSKVEVLHFRSCVTFDKSPHLKMPFLKEFHFPVYLDNVCSWFDGDVSYLRHLEILNLTYAEVTTDLFRIIQNTALNLVELYLCNMSIGEETFEGSTDVFPQLKVICLMYNNRWSGEGVLSLMRSCRSLQKIYLDEEVLDDAVQSFACDRKIEIVWDGHCYHDAERDYLHE